LTVRNISKTASSVKVYFNEIEVLSVDYAGAVELTGVLDIDLSEVDVEGGEYTVYARVIDKTGYVQTNSVVYKVVSTKPVFADNSWTDIIAASEADAIPATWKEGDEKEVVLTTGETIVLQIIGFKHDDLADGSGKAGMTLYMKDCLATRYYMNWKSTNAGGWGGSDMRTRMDTFYSYLPVELQTGIKAVIKKTSKGSCSDTIETTTDKLFLLSHIEVMGTNYGSTTVMESYAGEGEQYDYFKQAIVPAGCTALNGDSTGTFFETSSVSFTTRFGASTTPPKNWYCNLNAFKGIGNNATSAAQYYLLRSPYYDAEYYFCAVRGSDTLVSYLSSESTSTWGVAFALCV
jgi:hypothetical protein